MEINEYQHPDFIWTWKTNKRARRVGLWIPYLQQIEKMPRRKDQYRFTFNGGEVICTLKEIEFLMLYGATGELSVEFLDRLAVNRIILMIHRRNMPSPYVFYPTIAQGEPDLITSQIMTRQNLIRRTYIARTLIFSRIKQMEKLIPVKDTDYRKLSRSRTLADIRSIEARITKRYWKVYYSKLGYNIARRDNEHPINQALNAGSYFIYGSILRWLLFHKLSPCHAFLHEPVSYPSLCYDLMEPYRHLIEESVAEAVVGMEEEENYPLTAKTLQILKARMESSVYVPMTRQTVATKNLLHGVVLALRSYLLGESRRFHIPLAGIRKGGRPPKAGYSLPGAK